QILLNLLSNAVKFTPAGGRVSLTATRSADGGIVLAVADTGLGMSPDEINIALTPFGQVENALSRKQAGTGLGLPLAKAMMEMHGGTLLVSSAPGKGTTVSLAFPPARVVGRVAPVPRMAAAANAEAPATPRIEDESPLLRPNANRAA
ncbi:MAG: ATP-binding protein, partial [Alphaproteobacteria bacterium]